MPVCGWVILNLGHPGFAWLLSVRHAGPSSETEAGSAEEQPARDSLILGNNKVVEQSTTFSENYFLSNA